MKPIQINTDLHARLKELASRKGLKLGRLVEQLIEAWLRRMEPPKRKAG